MPHAALLLSATFLATAAASQAVQKAPKAAEATPPAAHVQPYYAPAETRAITTAKGEVLRLAEPQRWVF